MLAAKAEGEPLTFCSNVAVGADGVLYFTQSSRRYNLDEFRGELLEHSSTGRLLCLRDGVVETVADGFAFANGVVLIEDGAAAVVAETGGYCLTRVQLERCRRRRQVALRRAARRLPGQPHPRRARADLGRAAEPPRPDAGLAPAAQPAPAHAVWATPERMQPGEKDLAWTVAVNGQGTVVRDLRGWGVDFRW